MTEGTYRNEKEIRDVVEKFELCEFALAEFTHARHLTVACWCLCTLSREEALDRMSRGLRNFISHHGRQGYHETITRFWMELLGSYLEKFAQGPPPLARINCALECYGSKEVLFSYYTRERVMSDIAKQEWVEPDLRAIDESGSSAAEEFDQLIERWIGAE
jgi:hypothetical protein